MPSVYGSAAGVRSRAGGATSVSGFSQLVRALKRMEDGTWPELRLKLREMGGEVALVAADNAPRRSGELQHSMKTSITQTSASVYSAAEYGGVQNVGGGPHAGWSHRGPHVQRAAASHYMQRAVKETQPYVEHKMTELLDWLMGTFLK